jgi:hypothetical protein
MAEKKLTLPPMSLGKSFLFSGIPALFFAALFWKVIPLIDMISGNPLFLMFMIGSSIASLVFLIASLRFYGKEVRTGSALTVPERFRLGSLTPKGWIWSVALSGFVWITYYLLTPALPWAQEHILSPPKYWVMMWGFDPWYFMEVRYSWWIFLGYSVLALLRIFAAEFWWRGYVLPRQEVSFGKLAWVVHGIFYVLFLLFMPWEIVRRLPACFAIPFVAQKSQNTWPGIIAQCSVELPTLFLIASRI